jgi:predicted dehydrogenase
VPIIEAALDAGKHVLSQKPYVLDLRAGERLIARAEKNGVLLAVNQNGRWAPHFSYMRHAIAKGLIGNVSSADFVVHWDHNWTADTVFNDIHHLALYDFGIHWFDIITVLFGDRRPQTVFARVDRSSGQRATPPLVASVVVGFDGGQARICYNADTRYGAEDTTTLVGEKGTLRATGRSFQKQRVTIFDKRGKARPKLEGRWFTNGFHGTMGELLCAVEDKRDPSHHARTNLDSLALCFAALKSADTGKPVKVGSVRALPR